MRRVLRNLKRSAFVLVFALWGVLSVIKGLRIQTGDIQRDDSIDPPQREKESSTSRAQIKWDDDSSRRRNNTQKMLFHHISGPQSSPTLTTGGHKTLRNFKYKQMGGADTTRGAGWMGNGSQGRLNSTKAYRPTIAAPKRKYPRILYFVHIHKSAGTFFCRLAYKNRVNANQASNCNVQDDQYCCGGEDTLQAQINFANWTYWDLVAIEREMFGSLAPDHYDYIVTLRDSKRRYYSHYNHLRRIMPIGPGIQKGGFGDSAWIFGNNTIVDRKIKSRQIAAGEDLLGDFSTWYRGQPDNWNTRILCGAKCRPQPKYQITKDLFEYTLRRIDKFRHVLFVEDMEASYNQLALEYKWRNFSDVAGTSNRENNDKDELVKRLANESWDHYMSVLDDALYEFARRKFELGNNKEDLWKPFKNQEILGRYFREGPAFGCSDACCGNCTSY